MNQNNKVMWLEGMMLRQQHFQQQERYFTHLVETLYKNTFPENYGFYTLDLSKKALSVNRIVISEASGMFPDGTPFVVKSSDFITEALMLENNASNIMVYLCLPLSELNSMRFQQSVKKISDENSPHNSEVDVVTGKLNLQLRTSNDDLASYITLPIAKVEYCNEQEGIVLDKEFIFPVMCMSASPKLQQAFEESVSLLEQRIKMIANRVTRPHKQQVTDLKEWLLLQALNNHFPIFKHLMSRSTVHPIYAYQVMIQLIGELSTFTMQEKYYDFPYHYQQHDLQNSMMPMFTVLRQQLNKTVEQAALMVTLSKTSHGWWETPTFNSKIFENSQIILAAKANLPPEELASKFLAQIKVASIDKIGILLNSQLPGLPLETLHTIPPAIPYYSDYQYFTVTTESDLWNNLIHSGQLAIHATTQLPQLELLCWIIKGENHDI